MVGETATRRGPSEREQLIIQRVAEGCKNREIADSLGTTEHVVKNYLRLIYDKLGAGAVVWNRVELALWYVARQLRAPSDRQTPDAKLGHLWRCGLLSWVKATPSKIMARTIAVETEKTANRDPGNIDPGNIDCHLINDTFRDAAVV
jgi:DNA-binding CsgD family transcriptional regulator